MMSRRSATMNSTGFANLQTIFKDAKFKVIGNIQYNGKLAFDGTTTVTTAGGVKVGFLGLTTPETATKAHPCQDPGRDLHGQGRAFITLRPKRPPRSRRAARTSSSR